MEQPNDSDEKNVMINSDLFCIDDLGALIHNLKGDNVNVHCPFCGKAQLVSQDNTDLIINSVGVYSQKLSKYFICKKKCIQEAHQNPLKVKFINVQKYEVCALNELVNHPSNLELQCYNKAEDMIAMVWEFYHPISSLLYSRQEKVFNVLEHLKNNNQIVFWNMINLNPSHYQPNLIIIPYNETRCTLSLFDFKTQKKYEFNFILTIKTETSKQDSNLPQEFLYSQNNNEIRILANVLDCNDELIQKANFKFDQFNKDFKQPKTNNEVKGPPGFNGPNQSNNLSCLLLRSLIINLPLSDGNKVGSVGKNDQNQNQNQNDSVRKESENMVRRESENMIRRESQDMPKRKVSRLNVHAPNYLNSNSENKSRKESFQFEQQRHRMSSTNIEQEEISQEDKQLLDQLEVMDTYDLSLIQGKISKLAKMNQGSRILQKILGKMNQTEIDNIIQEIEKEISSLMLDYYGNYMIQSLINVCTVEQRYQVLNQISHKISYMAFDKKGTHSLQTVISLTSLDREVQLIVDSFEKDVYQLSMSNNGTHFVQKAIVCFDIKFLHNIADTIINNFVDFANNAQGLCVLKQIITKFINHLDYSQRFIQKLVENCEILIQSPFGNYAIQHSYEVYGYEKNNELTQKILSKLIQFSSQKFSSNVIEKLVSQFHQNFLSILIAELVKNDQIRDFMKNKYGSFILLKILQLIEMVPQYFHNQTILQEAIKKNLNYIHASNFKTKWQSYLERCQQQIVFPMTDLDGINQKFK